MRPLPFQQIIFFWKNISSWTQIFFLLNSGSSNKKIESLQDMSTDLIDSFRLNLMLPIEYTYLNQRLKMLGINEIIHLVSLCTSQFGQFRLVLLYHFITPLIVWAVFVIYEYEPMQSNKCSTVRTVWLDLSLEHSMSERVQSALYGLAVFIALYHCAILYC